MLRALIVCAICSLALPAGKAKADGLRVIDGDTFVFIGMTIRIADMDAPEQFKSRCPAESLAADRATKALTRILKSGNLTFEAVGYDKYERTLANVYVDGKDVALHMIREGHALPYYPGNRHRLARAHYWCRYYRE